MAGIVEEQHPDRARLFMQWKGMDWPLMVDSINLLETRAVPITLLIDEHGVIRKINPKTEDLSRFMATEFDPPPGAAEPPPRPNWARLQAGAEEGKADDWLALGDARFLWKDDSQLGEAIAAYQRAAERAPRSGMARFRLGVAYRKRFDSRFRQQGDFSKAVEEWGRALELDPNQYIWRRRVQQYGPRLDKPYPFYDWVEEARREIRARGDQPIPIRVEPSGAEIASPARGVDDAPATERSPDPEGRITRDGAGWIAVETTVVPARPAAGEAVRVHATLQPASQASAHWNNEAEPLAVWVDPPKGWTIDRRLHRVENPREATSREARRIEFEVQIPLDYEGGAASIPAYALYNVCEDANGVCLFRRQDFTVRIETRP